MIQIFKEMKHLLVLIFLNLCLVGNVFSYCNFRFSPSLEKSINKFNKKISLYVDNISKEINTKKPKNKALYYITAIKPTFDALSDKDKRFFLLLESPFFGVFNNLVGTAIPRIIAGGDINPAELWINFKESYLSYQLSSIPSSSVATDNSLSKNTRVMLSYLYSVIFYSAFTAGEYLVAPTQAEKVVGWSLVTFALVWPMISKNIATRVWVPLLFSKFPQKDLVKDLFGFDISIKTVLNRNKDNSVKPSLKKLIEKQLTNFEQGIELIQRENSLPEAVLSSFDEIKDFISSGVYYETTNEWGRNEILREKIKKSSRLVSELIDNKQTQRDLEALTEKLNVGLYWSSFVRKKNLSAGSYYSMKLVLSNLIAAVMITSYFLTRWEVVGKKKSSDKVNPNEGVEGVLEKKGIITIVIEKIMTRCKREDRNCINTEIALSNSVELKELMNVYALQDKTAVEENPAKYLEMLKEQEALIFETLSK